MRSFTRLTLFTIGLFVLSGMTGIVSAQKLEKLKAEEIIAKHLASIGTNEARAEVKTMTAVGKSQLVIKGRGSGETTGVVLLASDGKKNLIGMKFNHNEYPYEKIGYDGDELTVGYLSPGVHSNFGEFLLFNRKTFQVGILGGVLSTGWELLNYDKDAGKLSCGGSMKFDDVKHYKCSYKPKKGSDLRVSLAFHPETFRHVRTEYTRVISSRQGTSVDNSARQNEQRYKMIESFSDFQDIGGLMMPHQYKIEYEVITGNGTTASEWRMDLADFQVNLPIEASSFKVDN